MVLDLVTNVHNDLYGKIYMKGIVSNNNYTMNTLLQHVTNHDNGKVPVDILQPKLFADPSH